MFYIYLHCAIILNKAAPTPPLLSLPPALRAPTLLCLPLPIVAYVVFALKSGCVH